MKVQFQNLGDGRTACAITARTTTPGELKVKAHGRDQIEALLKAALLVERVASDPVMRQL